MMRSKLLTRIASLFCAALMLAALPVGLSAAEQSDKTQMTVASVRGLKVYSSAGLTGTSVSYSEGTSLTVSPDANGTVRVYGENGNILGYASAVNLVSEDDNLFYFPPYLYEDGRLSDMVDLDYYLYTHPESRLINGRDDTVILQRDVIDVLEKVAATIGTYQIWIEQGYAKSNEEPYQIMLADEKISFNTGCAVVVSIHDSTGVKVDLTLQGSTNKTMSAYNLNLYDNPNGNGVYYFNRYGAYLGVDIADDQMPMISIGK